jgi:hypothetical protein
MASGTIGHVVTMDFSTHCCTSLGPRLIRLGGLVLLAVGLAISMPRPLQAQHEAPEVTEFRLERQEDGLYLSALVRFELTAPVEDALQKGVPMFFVAEADLRRERWYWYDQKVASAAKTLRLSYQPLTRRWRLNSMSGTQGDSAGALNQHFDTLPEALATLRRMSRWKIAEAADLVAGARHHVDFRFKLDVSQLPRPFQIGAVGQADWNLAASISQRVGGDAP